MLPPSNFWVRQILCAQSKKTPKHAYDGGRIALSLSLSLSVGVCVCVYKPSASPLHQAVVKIQGRLHTQYLLQLVDLDRAAAVEVDCLERFPEVAGCSAE